MHATDDDPTEAAGRRSVRRPSAVFVGGPPASGKSTLARSLAPWLGAAVLDLDVATGPLTDVVLRLSGAENLDDERAIELTREPRYRTLLDLACDVVHGNCSVVLVAPFSSERSADRWRAVTARFDGVATTHLVWLELPPAELTRRLAERRAPRDEHRQARAAAWAAEWDARAPTAPHLLLDARGDRAELVDRIVAYVGR